MESGINNEDRNKKCELAVYLNTIGMILDRDISLTNHQKICKLMKQKENMKLAGVWELFLSNKETNQYIQFNKLKLDTIDDELFNIIIRMRQDFNNLKVSRTNFKIDEWANKLFIKLTELNVFEKFVNSTHEYFKFYQDIFNKINAVDQAKEILLGNSFSKLEIKHSNSS